MYRATKALLADNVYVLLFGCALYLALWNVLLFAKPLHTSGVAAWWTGLYAITLFNICAWRLSGTAVARRKETLDPKVHAFQRTQLMLSLVYVLGCGFRSILPRADVQRFGLHDSWMSSVVVGRSVATVAELCFVIQWALLLYVVSRDARSRLGMTVAWLVVPLIFLAEMCSWYGVLTTCYLGNSIEESLWTLTAGLIVLSCFDLWPRSRSFNRLFLGTAIVLGSAYVLFMCTVDVPMYLTRYLEDQAAGRHYFTLGAGFWDAWSRRDVTHEWAHWSAEVPWMTLYFSVAVWFSIALAHAPVRIRSRRKTMLGRP